MASMSMKHMVYGAETLHLYVDMSVGIGGDRWPAADLFNQLLTHARWRPLFSKLFENKTVLELGAGTGVNSILIDRLFSPISVIVTDHHSHVHLIQKNLSENKCSDNVEAKPLDWLNLPECGHKADVVLAFECVYKEELYDPFIEALLSTTNEKSLIFLGVTRSFAKPLFFEKLRSRGFEYTLVPQEAYPVDYSNEFSGRDVGTFVCTRNIQPPVPTESSL